MLPIARDAARLRSRSAPTVAGELETLRDAHAAWWSDWLEPRAVDPADEDFAQVDRFYDDVRAAMDWAANDPRLGLRLLYSFAKVCQDLGRAGDAVAAAERLLTPDDAGPYGELWLRAAGATSIRYDLGGSYDDYLAFVQRMSDVATRLADPYHLALARFHTSNDPGDALILFDLADQRGESYVSAMASAMYAQTIADGDPSAARDALRDAEVVAVGVGSRIPLDYVRRTACRHARDTGRLATSISLARTLLSSSSQLLAQSGVLMLGEVGLLAGETDAIREAIVAAEHLGRGEGVTIKRATGSRAPHTGWRSSKEATPAKSIRSSAVHDQSTSAALWVWCREATDGDHADVAVRAVSSLPVVTPYALAVRTAIQAAAGHDELLWHQALDVAAAHDLALITIDALEGLAAAAIAADSSVECLRLIGAAERLRAETGYLWRFAGERARLEAARTAAFAALGDGAEPAYAEGRTLARADAIAYARRSRGERKRPRHGWASLTPTERRVAALVAEGLTNPQIAGRLLMGRATVKAHLEHIYPEARRSQPGRIVRGGDPAVHGLRVTCPDDQTLRSAAGRRRPHPRRTARRSRSPDPCCRQVGRRPRIRGFRASAGRPGACVRPVSPTRWWATRRRHR